MSLQDKIFDVQHVLEGTPEAQSFKDICDFYFKVEEDHDRLLKIYKAFRTMRDFLTEGLAKTPDFTDPVIEKSILADIRKVETALRKSPVKSRFTSIKEYLHQLAGIVRSGSWRL